MNKEKFLAKGVARKYENGEVVFSVESLHEHYEGVEYHDVDVVDGFIRPNDIFGGDIREIEVVVEEAPVLEIEVTAAALEENPQLVAEEIKVGEILTVDAEEVSGENVIEGELNTEV